MSRDVISTKGIMRAIRFAMTWMQVESRHTRLLSKEEYTQEKDERHIVLHVVVR